jgi:oligoribonuclease NrnB/cAMP/cGMP phosphodiesterase (DHH superfamily)
MIVFIVVMYMQNRKYNEDKNRIQELERRLNEYYIQREKRLEKLNTINDTINEIQKEVKELNLIMRK